MDDLSREKKSRLCHDLWVVWKVQVVAVMCAVICMVLYRGDLVPNYPAWDTVHSLCGVGSLAGMIVFLVTMLWGSYKFMDTKTVSVLVRVYAASLWLWIPFLLCLATFPVSTAVTLILFVLLPVYSIVPQFIVFRRFSRGL